MNGHITITAAGSAVVTDLGRTRGPRYGIPVNGALDQYSARVANVLVGNDQHDPIVEVTALDVEFIPDVDILFAVTGARVSVSVAGVAQPQWQPISASAGETVSLTRMSAGLRAYLAVHGSFDVPFLLDSCAPDTVLGFGLRLTPGDDLRVRRSVPPIINPHFRAALYDLKAPVPVLEPQPVIQVTDGPDRADFGASADLLFRHPFTVQPNSNHIGLRLGGEVPRRESTDELLSRGVPVGAVEAPPGDELLILHRGRGVTAGYPVLAVVTAVSLNALAQVRPGQQVEFRHVALDDAVAAARAERDAVNSLRTRVRNVFTSLEAGVVVAQNH